VSAPHLMVLLIGSNHASQGLYALKNNVHLTMGVIVFQSRHLKILFFSPSFPKVYSHS